MILNEYKLNFEELGQIVQVTDLLDFFSVFFNVCMLCNICVKHDKRKCFRLQSISFALRQYHFEFRTPPVHACTQLGNQKVYSSVVSWHKIHFSWSKLISCWHAVPSIVILMDSRSIFCASVLFQTKCKKKTMQKEEKTPEEKKKRKNIFRALIKVSLLSIFSFLLS